MTKSKTPKGTKVNEVIDFDLTDKQRSEKGLLAAQLMREADEVTKEKADANKSWNSTIKAKTNRVHELLTQIERGVEPREVECTMVKNYDKGDVEFWLDGKKLKNREMTHDERQTSFDEAEQPAPQRKGRKLSVAPEQSPEEDVAKVIKDETRKSTKRSSVDARPE